MVLLLLLLLLKMLGVLRMLRVLLHLLPMLRWVLLLGVASRRVRNLLRRCWALTLSRGGCLSLGRRRLLLLL